MKALVSPEKKAEWKINKQEFISELQEKDNRYKKTLLLWMDYKRR